MARRKSESPRPEPATRPVPTAAEAAAAAEAFIVGFLNFLRTYPKPTVATKASIQPDTDKETSNDHTT